MTILDAQNLLQQTFPDMGLTEIDALLQAATPQYYAAGVDICCEEVDSQPGEGSIFTVYIPQPV